MNTRLRFYALLSGAALLGGVGGNIARDYREPDYYWYDVPQTDSVRTLLNMTAPGTVLLKLEKRPKWSRHIWVGVIPADSLARIAVPFEVEESWPCPPNCRQ